jgi:hypothetical protein
MIMRYTTCLADRGPGPDPADEQVKDATKGDLDQARDSPYPPGQEADSVGPNQVSQAEDLPPDDKQYGEDEDRRCQHALIVAL